MIDLNHPPSPYEVARLAGLPLSIAQAAILKSMGPEDLTSEELSVWRDLTGTWFAKPSRSYRELWFTAGRRSGKTTRILAAIAVSVALDPKYEKNIAPGERPAVFLAAPILEKTGQLFNTIRGLLDLLGVAYTPRDGVLSLEARPVDIRVMVMNAVHAAADSAKAIIVDDLAKGQVEEGAKHDATFVSTARAMTLSTGGLFVSGSQAWSQDGIHYETCEKFWKKTDGNVLVVKGSTWAFVPEHTRELCLSLAGGDARVFKREYEAIPGANDDALLDGDEIRACVAPGVRERPFSPRMRYAAAADLAFRNDFSALSIGHLEARRLPDGSEQTIVVEDRLLCWKPRRGAPLSPEAIVREICAELRAFRITTLAIDQFNFASLAERFAHYSIKVEELKTDTMAQAKRTELFATRLRSKTIALLDDAEANKELARLRMKLRSNGMVSYAAPQNAHDHDDRADARFGMVERVQHAARASAPNIREDRRVVFEPGVGIRARTQYLQRTKVASGAVVEIPVAPPAGTLLHDLWVCDALAAGQSTPETEARLRQEYGDVPLTVEHRRQFLADHDPRFPPGEQVETDDDAEPTPPPEAPAWLQNVNRRIPEMGGGGR